MTISRDDITRLMFRLNQQLEDLHRDGDQWKAKCPAHRDNKPSLAIKEGDDGRILLYCHAGCSTESILRAWGVSWSTLFPDQPQPNGSTVPAVPTVSDLPPSGEPEAVYPYHDEQGELLYEAVRFPGKRFRLRRRLPDGSWTWNVRHTRRVLYHLDELRGAETVWLVEGEKDADRLRSTGLVVTTAPLGAGPNKWRPEYTEQLNGVKVIYQIADNDEPGRDYADSVARELMRAGIEVRRVELNGVPDGGDVSDWLDAGNDPSELGSTTNTHSVSVLPIYVGTETESHRWLSISAAELLEEADNEPPELVAGGLCPAGGLSILGAKPKVGKSTLARFLAVCVAQGKDFLGRPVQQGTVLYVALEEKRREVREHFRRLGAKTGDPIYIVFEIDPKRALLDLVDAIGRYRPALVIIDPLFRFLAVRDVADYADIMNKLAPVLGAARASGTHLFLTHHNTKVEREGGDDLLGSTAIFGAVDTAIVYRRQQDGTRFAYSVQRYGTDLPKTVLALTEDGEVIPAGDLDGYQMNKTAEEILEFLKDQVQPIATFHLIEIMEVNRQRALRALSELFNQGRISRWGTGVKGDPFRYSIPTETEKPQEPREPQEQEKPEEPENDTDLPWWQK